MDRMTFLGMKYNNVIENPFPDLAFDIEYKWSSLDRLALDRILAKDYPNPWMAYKLGYEKAYKEMEEKLVSQE